MAKSRNSPEGIYLKQDLFGSLRRTEHSCQKRSKTGFVRTGIGLPCTFRMFWLQEDAMQAVGGCHKGYVLLNVGNVLRISSNLQLLCRAPGISGS